MCSAVCYKTSLYSFVYFKIKEAITKIFKTKFESSVKNILLLSDQQGSTSLI